MEARRLEAESIQMMANFGMISPAEAAQALGGYEELSKVRGFQNAGSKLMEERMGFGGVKKNRPQEFQTSMPEISRIRDDICNRRDVIMAEA